MIDLTGMDMVDVSVHGALDSTQKATLEAWGGNYAVGGSGHLIWIAERALLPSEVLTVKLSDKYDKCDIADQGKTIAELYPDDEPCTISDFSIDDQRAAEIRARPRLHEDFIVQAETSSAKQVTAASDERNTDFTFNILWHNLWPTQARVRLATYCLTDVLARTAGTEHLQTMLCSNDSASFVLLR